MFLLSLHSDHLVPPLSSKKSYATPRHSSIRRGKKMREKEGRSYHDITPLLCCYVSEWHSSSLMSRVARGGQSGGRGGMWGVRVSEVEFLNYCWGMDLRMGKPHVV